MNSEESGSRKRRHHHKGHGYSRSRRHRQHNMKMRRIQIGGSILICAVVVAVAGIFVWRQQVKQGAMQVTASNSHDVGSGYRNIEYNGEKYRYNNLVTTVLVAGIDSTGTMEGTVQYGNKARADSISLVVMDQRSGKMTVIAINRDTMTDIRRYSLNGNDEGLYTTHIGYAYSYGDGGDVSCENLCEAVSLLFGEVPIRNYVVVNQDSVTWLNDLIGGVTVTVPNSDLEKEYEDFYEGAVVTLDDSNVLTYLQYRDTEEDYSNEGRMERQEAYITAYINKAKALSTTELEDVWDSLEGIEDYLQTNITRNKYLDLIDVFEDVEFSEANYEQLTGSDAEGALHDEFYPDEEALQEKIIELFYIKV